MSYYFVIISPRDSPLYEVHLSSKPSGGGSAGLSAGLGGFGGGLFGGASSSAQSTAAAAAAAANPSGAAAAAAAAAATPRAGTGLTSYTWRSTLQMIAHSSLDSIYDKSLRTSQMYLRTIDRTQQQFVSCFLLPNRYFFVILHEHKHEEGIRNFFLDAWELLLKTFINPLHDPLNPIRSPAFDTRIRASARRHL
ncbi:Sedlin [Ceraceosorus guamensis]|uniref:Sedlin n=1 Tax=Ceraceosorus guamensis TaxID=1522189 RepID=A0A316VR93_9BASI|nr:Sedlin [Ceraceosorus guamensis]PWN39870.1 Sedlin [Ceraceosorus guamensis]